MQNLQNLVFRNTTPPGAIVDAAAFTTATIDTLGFRSLLILVTLGALDIAVAVMKAQESDASNMAGATDIPGTDFSVLPLTLPSATADNGLYGIFIELKGRKRYIDMSLTGGDGATGTFATVLAILDRGESGPNSATARGFAQQANG